MKNLHAKYDLGEPDGLFYWGPTRAKAMYMSDFVAGMERFFIEMARNPKMPSPPKTVALFINEKNVWLINAKDFAKFTENTFQEYAKQNRLDSDRAKWQKTCQQLLSLSGKEFDKAIVDAWYYTEFAEFSLYGAESALSKKLQRFDDKTRQEIWATFTYQDNLTFLFRIDQELVQNQDYRKVAKKYPWIKNGYNGPSSEAEDYFKDRLEVIKNETFDDKQDYEAKRQQLIKKYSLNQDEVDTLTLTRQLAEFMDERKAWMMQTRPLIKRPLSHAEFGWYFDNGGVSLINYDDVEQLWQRYIDYKTAKNAVVGTVACNGGKNFIDGQVAIANSPTDIIESDRILVIPATGPSYVPMMRKARALVTDHGGIMSHAAIVAREFNLPCIVGTKQATKVLKNGDNVILNLVTGEINR